MGRKQQYPLPEFITNSFYIQIPCEVLVFPKPQDLGFHRQLFSQCSGLSNAHLNSHYSLLAAFSDSSIINLLEMVNAITLDKKGEAKHVIEVRLFAQEQLVTLSVGLIKGSL